MTPSPQPGTVPEISTAPDAAKAKLWMYNKPPTKIIIKKRKFFVFFYPASYFLLKFAALRLFNNPAVVFFNPDEREKA